jgi:hypothetical protein
MQGLLQYMQHAALMDVTTIHIGKNKRSNFKVLQVYTVKHNTSNINKTTLHLPSFIRMICAFFIVVVAARDVCGILIFA